MSEVLERFAVLMLHPRCNMRCDFCITDNGMATMSFAQGVETLALLRARGFGNVVFGGGEPTVWPHDVTALAAHAKALGFSTQLGTNGVALPDDFTAQCAFDRYVLPLDAADAATHDLLRHHRGGHHHCIMTRLAQLRGASRSVTVSTVVTQRNANTLSQLADTLVDYAALGGQLHAWHLYRFLPYGRGGAKHADDLDISEAVYHDACNTVRARQLPFRVFKRPDMRHSKHVDFFWYEGHTLHAGSERWSTHAPDAETESQAMGWPCQACGEAATA